MKRTNWTLTTFLVLSVGCGAAPAEESDARAERGGEQAGREHAGGEQEHHGDHERGHHHAHHGEGHHHDNAPPPEPTQVMADGSQQFGAALDESVAATPLADIMANPAAFAGQVVRTEGEITQVCQSRGCWMEIRPDTESAGIRVPMAGHRFFLPRDISGRRATLQGTVVIAELSEADRAHLESEGAQAAGQDLSIEAMGVLVHP